MNIPLVSVIIPTYNRANLIERTIENVLEQTYSNVEIIIVDDGSTDDTSSKLREFGDRIRVITQANAGASAARNRGIEISRGEIIAFQDSDDLWMPSKLERQVALLQQTDSNVPCCLCNAEMHFNGKPITASFEVAWIRPPIPEGLWLNVPEFLATTFVLFNQSVAIRSAILKKIGGFDERLKYMEDYDLALRLSIEGSRWAFIRDPLVVWRQGSPGSLSEEALAEEVRKKEFEIIARESALKRVRTGNQYSELRRILQRELNRNHRGLAIARIAQSNAFGASALSKLLKRVERYRKGVYHRSPWFPRPKFQQQDKNQGPSVNDNRPTSEVNRITVTDS